MHIALFSPEFPPHIFGGLGTHVANLTANMTGTIIFDLFVPHRAGYKRTNPAICIHEVPVVGAQTNVDYWLRFCTEAVTLARQLTKIPDLLHCHEWMTVPAGFQLRSIWKIPLVYNIHLPQVSSPTIHEENLGLVAADLVLVNSQAVHDEIMARNLIDSKMAIVPNGIDLDRFHPATELSTAEDYILFVGRLVPQKGVDVLLHAFSVVLRRCPEARLVVVGDGDLELYLKRVTYYLGIPHRVSFIQWQSEAELVALYQHASFVIIPSQYEPFGIVALEAMACGKPVIASRVGGLKEIITDNVHGYLTSTGDYLQLAQQIVKLLLNPQRRRQMGLAARERARDYSWNRVAEITIGHYQKLVSESIVPISSSNELIEELLTNLEPTQQSLAETLFLSARGK